MQQLVNQGIFAKVSNIRGRLIGTHLHQVYFDKETPQQALKDLADIIPLDRMLNKVFQTFYIVTEPQLEYIAKQSGESEDSNSIQNLRANKNDFFHIDKKGFTHPVDFALAMSVFGMIDYYLGLQAQKGNTPAYSSRTQTKQPKSDYKEHVMSINRYPGDNRTQKSQQTNQQRNEYTNTTNQPAKKSHPMQNFWKRAKVDLLDFLKA